ETPFPSLLARRLDVRENERAPNAVLLVGAPRSRRTIASGPQERSTLDAVDFHRFHRHAAESVVLGRGSSAPACRVRDPQLLPGPTRPLLTSFYRPRHGKRERSPRPLDGSPHKATKKREAFTADDAEDAEKKNASRRTRSSSTSPPVP